MKLLLTGAFKYTQEQIEYIKSLGNDVVFIQNEREPIDIDVSDIEGVVCNSLFYYNDIKPFKSLKYIQLTSAGLDRVPLDYIRDNNIALYNARGVYSVPMAEFAVRGVLDLYKQTFKLYENQKNHIWLKERQIPELFGKNVLIVGAGSIGQAVAKRFKAFDTTVVGIDTVDTARESFDEIKLPNELDSEIKNADIVILTLPLTKENVGFFDKSKFDLMKESAMFVNIARGKLVNQKDLINVLKDNKIYGAVIDVFEEEPLSADSDLWDMDNLVLTPHNSFVGENNQKRMYDVIIKNLVEFGR